MTYFALKEVTCQDGGVSRGEERTRGIALCIVEAVPAPEAANTPTRGLGKAWGTLP